MAQIDKDPESGSKGSSKSSSRRQVELSHGSASTKASIYRSEDEQISTCSCWLELAFGFCIIVFTILVLLFWCEAFDEAEIFFQKHKSSKLIVLAVLLSVDVFFALLLIVRIVYRICRSQCYQDIGTAWYSTKSESSTSIMRDEEFMDSTPSYSGQKYGKYIRQKVNDLSEQELADVFKILTAFKNYHESDDWVLTTSTSTLSRMTFSGSADASFTEPKSIISAKLVFAGAPKVGKTSLFHRILYNRFTDYYVATLGTDIGHTTLHIFPKEPNNHLQVNLQLWDVAGSEHLSELSHVVYKDASAFIVVSDITDPDSSLCIAPWVKDINEAAFQPYIAEFVTKIDESSNIKTLKQNSCNEDVHDVFMVSAKTGLNLLESLVEVVSGALLKQVENSR